MRNFYLAGRKIQQFSDQNEERRNYKTKEDRQHVFKIWCCAVQYKGNSALEKVCLKQWYSS